MTQQRGEGDDRKHQWRKVAEIRRQRRREREDRGRDRTVEGQRDGAAEANASPELGLAQGWKCSGTRPSTRALGQIRRQHRLAVGMALGIEVDEDFGAREAALQILLDPVHAIVRLAHRPVAGTQTWNCAK